MNGPHTPAFSRNNKWTQLIERVGAQNAADGKPAGRMIEQIGNTTPLISAARVARMSPAERMRTDYVPDADDPRVAMMANARAAALGITNDNRPQLGDDLPSDIGRVSDELNDAEIDQMLAAAKGQSLPGIHSAAEGAAAPGVPGPAAAGLASLPRGRAAQPVGLAGARSMPNFANVEGFDLTRKVVVVDGMEFKLGEENVVAMKKFAIQVVLDNVTYQLAQALVQLGIPQEMAQATADKMRETAAAAGATPGGMSGDTTGREAVEAVQEVRGEEAARGVLPRPPDTGHADSQVSVVHQDVQRLDRQETDEPVVQANREGSSQQSQEHSRAFGPANDADYLLGDG